MYKQVLFLLQNHLALHKDQESQPKVKHKVPNFLNLASNQNSASSCVPISDQALEETQKIDEEQTKQNSQDCRINSEPATNQDTATEQEAKSLPEEMILEPIPLEDGSVMFSYDNMDGILVPYEEGSGVSMGNIDESASEQNNKISGAEVYVILDDMSTTTI